MPTFTILVGTSDIEPLLPNRNTIYGSKLVIQIEAPNSKFPFSQSSSLILTKDLLQFLIHYHGPQTRFDMCGETMGPIFFSFIFLFSMLKWSQRTNWDLIGFCSESFLHDLTK